jgi:hypothetical protein
VGKGRELKKTAIYSKLFINNCVSIILIEKTLIFERKFKKNRLKNLAGQKM